MPGASFKRYALKTREVFFEAIGRPLTMVQDRRV